MKGWIEFKETGGGTNISVISSIFFSPHVDAVVIIGALEFDSREITVVVYSVALRKRQNVGGRNLCVLAGGCTNWNCTVVDARRRCKDCGGA